MLLWRLRTGLRCFAYGIDDLALIQQQGKSTDHLKERPQLERKRVRDSLPSLDNKPTSPEDEEQMLREVDSNPRKEYKKKVNKTAEDFQIEQLREKDREFEKMVREYFKNENSGFDPQNYTRVEKTKRLTRALRMNSVFDFAKEKSPHNLAANYNNYDKFKLNYNYYFTRPDSDYFDTGAPMRKKMVADYLDGLSPSGEYRDSEDAAAREDERNKRAPQDPSTAMSELLEEGVEEAEAGEAEQTTERSGRLSPHAREQIYRLYESGWTVTDLSYRYGILPARVKAVVWCRRHFYEEVQPRIDPITWKLGVEREFLYASQFPFVDYGIDLQAMAIFEKGLQTARLTRRMTDAEMPEEVKAKIRERLARVRPLPRKMVENYVVGKGPGAYKVKDYVVCRGNGRHSVSEMFKRVCMWGDTKPHWLPKKVEAKVNLGPRIASQGFRMGGRMRSYNK